MSNVVVAGNKIVFDEFTGKTYKGGLKDLKNKPRYIEQNNICTNSVFNNCPINFVVKKNHLMY